MKPLPVGHCDQILHEARNGCLALRGLLIKLRRNLDECGVVVDLSELEDQIHRINEAVTRCGSHPEKH